MREVMKRVGKDSLLDHHVGLNMDIAHMKIVPVEANQMDEDLQKRFVHAHICDHPKVHTRDQVLGMWTSIERHSGEYYPYLRILAERAKEAASGKGLPFSGAVALELEGCNRIDWVHHGLAGLKHLLAVTRNHDIKGISTSRLPVVLAGRR